MADDERMCGWTIYCRPLDFPNHYVIRQWDVTDDGLVWHLCACVCDSLAEAREQVPVGTICFPREELDDPVIVETWL
jgi:hypothetical protein